jgi:alkylation response protein AidB-like acyl-CoA dehydrogenase
MDFRFSPEEEAFRREVREYLDREYPLDRHSGALPDGSTLPTPEPHVPGYMPSREAELKIGAKGWLALNWPVEYGGGGKPLFYQVIVDEELAYYSVPGAESMGRTIIAPNLLAWGSEEIKREVLPKVASGEADICLGYTEPEAGSDLASLRTRAVFDGDDYVINGAKVYTSGADISQYCWLLTRTDPEAPRHRALSLFMVPMDLPGITVRPLPNLLDISWFTEITFEDVRVPRRWLVGEENQAWQIVTSALASERLALYHWRSQRRLFESVLEFAKRVQKDGRPLAKDPALRCRLADMAIEFEVGRLLTYRAQWLRSQGHKLTYEAALVKAFNTEMTQRLGLLAMDIIGLYGGLLPSSARTVLDGIVAHGYLDAVQGTIGAGASEVMRDIIARAGLGLPRG